MTENDIISYEIINVLSLSMYLVSISICVCSGEYSHLFFSHCILCILIITPLNYCNGNVYSENRLDDYHSQRKKADSLYQIYLSPPDSRR